MSTLRSVADPQVQADKWPDEHNDNADMIRDTAYYECEHCGGHIHDKQHKMEMLRHGKWEAVNASQSKVRSISYHLSSIYFAGSPSETLRTSLRLPKVHLPVNELH